ncbi:MAG: TonB-dependent receptor [Halieaceae bacterium]|nr:TonB-dependent receptor [Halieaceae bacterium]
MIASGLSFRGNIGLLDASFDEHLVSSATGMVDKSGIELRRAPDMTMGLGLLWEHELANGAFLVTNVSYTWKDDYYISASTSVIKPNYGGGAESFNPSKVDAFGLLDTSINYETESWSISIFGKNLTDENYFMSFLDVGGNVVATGAGDTTAVYAPGL